MTLDILFERDLRAGKQAHRNAAVHPKARKLIRADARTFRPPDVQEPCAVEILRARWIIFDA
jgi:hypothetical protein